MTDQLFQADHEPPHGPVFRHACRLIRANPRASGETPPLRERLLNTGAHQSLNGQYHRIRKLLALAQSYNRHEAEAALAKAYHLMAKYHIDLPDQGNEPSYHSIFLGRPALRHFREAYHLAQLVQRFCFVSGIWVPAYVVAKGKMGRVLEISGTLPNLQLAEYVYTFVSDFIDRQWRAFNYQHEYNRYRKTDFAIGIIEGFMTKMNTTARTSEHRLGSDSLAIMLKTNPGLQSYLKDRYPHTSSFRRSVTRENVSIRAAGESLGRRLIIAKPIEDNQRNSGPAHLLGH
jgi:hypothetical protein